MEDHRFDILARSLSGAGASRRQVMRTIATTLLGGALGSLATRVGLTEGAAKQKHPSRKHAHHPSHHPASRHRHSKDVHGQGKGTGKKHHKKQKSLQSPPSSPPPPVPSSPPPPLPPGCQSCNECQMCQDGACVADPALNGVRCLGSGTACGYCSGGQCAASALPPCDDGTCVQTGQCCPGQKRCPDPNPEGPGFACVGLDDCCPDQKPCASGCVYKQACCPEERPPDCGQCGDICVNGTWRCSAAKPCGDGTCVAHDECCHGEKPCPGGGCVPPDQCCPGDKPCGHGTCVPEDICCPDDPLPNCEFPEEERCCHGEKVCRGEWDTPTCFPYGAWLTYNEKTCDCECPADSVPTALSRYCCPASHPQAGPGFMCFGEDWTDRACLIGFKICEDDLSQCCVERYPWPPE